jgi:hypothetical protein
MKDLVKTLYKNRKGYPYELTDGQAVIFALIFKRKYKRVHIECFTRFGKSETIALGVLTRRATYPGKSCIVAGNTDKAGIIMGYVIEHIFDNPFTRSRFIIGAKESEESIRRYRNKDRINFDTGNGTLGEIFITTAAGALGFGADDVIEDEAALIKGNDHALVMRMLGDSPDSFLCKVGNPWDEEHFNKSRESPFYKKLIIDYRIGLAEGRVTPEKLEEAKKEAFYDVLYECKIPSQAIMDATAWIPLFTREQITNAMVDEVQGFGINKLGADVAAGGRNFSVVVQRHTNAAKKIYKASDPDTMNLAEFLMTKKEGEKIRNQDLFIDNVGVGMGAWNVLNRAFPGMYGVNAGEKPDGLDAELYVNRRAEMYWKGREWIIGGGKLLRDDDWYELCKIKYRRKLEGTKGKLLLMSKEEMAKDGIPSPDCADAWALTFRTADVPPEDPEVVEMRERVQEKFDPFNPFGAV